MKKTITFFLTIMLVMLTTLTACSTNPEQSESLPQEAESSIAEISELNVTGVKSTGQIYLYGEIHGQKKILDKELELWGEYYLNEGMRHLFIEDSYYSAEFLNLWMQAENDDLLDIWFKELEGTQGNTPQNKEFFQELKLKYPETIFHGTDVGHQNDTTGKRYLEYLKSIGQEGSAEYLLTEENIEQGKFFYMGMKDVYRENMMVENFIREFDGLADEDIMGIYGAAHTGLSDLDFTGSVACMANQLNDYYGDALHSEDLSWLAEESQALRMDLGFSHRLIINKRFKIM